MVGRQGGSTLRWSADPRTTSAITSFVCTRSSISTDSRNTSRGLRSGVMLRGVNSVAKEAGKHHQESASHLELPRSLYGHPRHHPQTLFRCAKANQAFNDEAPPQQCQYDGYTRPYVMKPNDESPKWQIQ